MKVVEIFKSIEGEGIRAGLPVTFIRLFGCNLNCSYCDTRYACEDKEPYSVMSIEEIMETVREYKLNRVTLTGGEPMIHPGVEKLLRTLIKEGYEVNVETNGTRFPIRFPQEPTSMKLNPVKMTTEPVFDASLGSVFYTMDWKCKSSGMEDKMDVFVVNELTEDDVLKFVVGSGEDMDGALQVIEQMTSTPTIYFSPVFGQIKPSEIVDYLLEKGLQDCRVQIQMHKVIWDPNMRGV